MSTAVENPAEKPAEAAAPTTGFQPEIGLRKAKKNHLVSEHIVKMERPDFTVDPETGDPKCTICYGTAAYKPKEAPCTQHIWRRAEGRSGEGVRRDGLSVLNGKCEFILYREKGKDEVVAIDIVPKDFFAGKGNAPASIHDLETGEFQINPSTGEITVEEHKLPIGFNKRQLHLVIRELNNADLLQAGTMLGGAYEIMDVRGNRVFIAPQRQQGYAGAPGPVGTFGG